MRLRRAASLLFGAALLAACRRDADTPRHGEARITANAEPAWPAGQGWKLDTTPLVVIGEVEGAEAYQLDGVVAALRQPDGTIVIGDRGSAQIRYYTPRGQHLRSVGGKGGGPGQFRVLDWIGERGDSMLAWDPIAARLTMFGPGGRLARELRIGAAANGLHQAVGVMGDGSLLMRPRSVDVGGAPGEHVDSVTYLRISGADGHALGTIGPFMQGDRVTTRSGALTLTGDVIFGRNGVIVPGPRGLFTGETGAFELTARSFDGTPLRTFGRPHAPVKASAGDVRAALEQRRAGADLGKAYPGMGRVEEAQLASLPHRDTLPAFTRALADGGGNLWIEEFRIDPAAAATWSVFDADGRWLGRVGTPAGLRLTQISGGSVIGVTRDELGVERVVVYRLLR
jgi:hypothetical protein